MPAGDRVANPLSDVVMGAVMNQFGGPLRSAPPTSGAGFDYGKQGVVAPFSFPGDYGSSPQTFGNVIFPSRDHPLTEMERYHEGVHTTQPIGMPRKDSERQAYLLEQARFPLYQPRTQYEQDEYNSSRSQAGLPPFNPKEAYPLVSGEDIINSILGNRIPTGPMGGRTGPRPTPVTTTPDVLPITPSTQFGDLLPVQPQVLPNTGQDDRFSNLVASPTAPAPIHINAPTYTQPGPANFVHAALTGAGLTPSEQRIAAGNKFNMSQIFRGDTGWLQEMMQGVGGGI